MLISQIFLVALTCCLLILNGCRAAMGPSYGADLKPRTGCIAIVGDTQRTLAVERIIGREQNDAERPGIISAIAQDHPDLLVHLGDAVATGASGQDWIRFDQLFTPIRAAGIPVLPVIGNHDYWGLRSAAMTNLRTRFPAAEAHWYAARYSNLALIWLDSNRASLSREEWERQSAWLKEQLAAADRDPAVKAVLVFCHHSPFTNSTVTTDDADVQETFLPPFNASKKAIAMICGHTHAYEHFEMQGKTFLVSGGGGGPRVKLLTPDAQRHPDRFCGPSPRPFHYLLLRPKDDELAVEVKGFDKGQTEIREIDRFAIPYRR
jgi:3',5'-cyclic AMP phosphodiesterase CpdA